MKTAIIHEEAELELGETLEYYAKQRQGLDGEFRREFEFALQRVCENPLLYSVEFDEVIRYCPLRRFPFHLVYIDLEDYIWVVAVAHQRRRPRYWSNRCPN